MTAFSVYRPMLAHLASALFLKRVFQFRMEGSRMVKRYHHFAVALMAVVLTQPAVAKEKNASVEKPLASVAVALPWPAVGGDASAAVGGKKSGDTSAALSSARIIPLPLPGCEQSLGTVVSGALACAGYYEGNIFGGSAAKVAEQNLGISLLGSSIVVGAAGQDSAFDTFSKTEALANGNTIQFDRPLYGETIVGAHFGNIAGSAQNVSVLWLFDFGRAGVSGLTLNNVQGFSNSVLYSTGLASAVPEPTTWALMIVGVGAVGGALRSRRTRRPKRALVAA